MPLRRPARFLRICSSLAVLTTVLVLGSGCCSDIGGGIVQGGASEEQT